MKETILTSSYKSPLGVYVMSSDGQSLIGLHYTKSQDDAYFPNHPVFTETRRWLDLYFNGEKPGFLPPLHPHGTPFQLKVWHELLTIPYGQTTSYGEIARRLQCRSAQAIGQAVHRNPIAIIIPCHRVIGANGSLVGYASGLEVKKRLLDIEKASIEKTSKSGKKGQRCN